MRNTSDLFALLLASLAAVLVPTVIVCALLGMVSTDDAQFMAWFWMTAGIVFALALLHLVLLGLPAMAWLRWKQRFRAWPTAVAGALVAMLPIGVLSIPVAPWADPGDTWLDMLTTVAVFALVGASSGLVFYGVWRAMTKRMAVG